MTNRLAIIDIAKFSVFCPVCDTQLSTRQGKKDWDLADVLAIENVSNHDECLMCHGCGEFLTVILPEAIAVVVTEEDDS